MAVSVPEGTQAAMACAAVRAKTRNVHLALTCMAIRREDMTSTNENGKDVGVIGTPTHYGMVVDDVEAVWYGRDVW